MILFSIKAVRKSLLVQRLPLLVLLRLLQHRGQQQQQQQQQQLQVRAEVKSHPAADASRPDPEGQVRLPATKENRRSSGSERRPSLHRQAS